MMIAIATDNTLITRAMMLMECLYPHLHHHDHQQYDGYDKASVLEVFTILMRHDFPDTSVLVWSLRSRLFTILPFHSCFGIGIGNDTSAANGEIVILAET